MAAPKNGGITPTQDFPQSIPGLYLSLSPVKGAVESFQWLTSQPSFDVYILTAPSVRNPHCYSEKRTWVEEHLGLQAAYKLIISPNKGLNRGDFLIDDKISGKGQEAFEGEILHFGSSEYPDWISVIDFFKSKYSLMLSMDEIPIHN
ncbi:5' nucleotidase, NT5C type [Pseudohongiella nitratireducens]|uniref:5' nucleotidase, NT5C type n=1 Tax=Pseudohongiella nitratireducens TaxID=1768907 RepID=UPI0009EF3C39|nr:hypothetical protein [Pseudohongiella nitratireducens]